MEATGAGGSLASFFPSIYHYTAFLTMLQLPEDIFLHILKQLDVDSDEPTIRNASLVSTAFREPCQKLLFSTLRLKPPKSFKSTYRYTPGARLLRLLKSSPVIMGYIQGITIIDSTPGSGADQPSWLSLDGRLAEALNQLSFDKIRRFELAMEYRLHWNHLNAPIQKTILAICRSPSLVSLSLTCAPIGLVNLCGPALKHLKLYDVGMVELSKSVGKDSSTDQGTQKAQDNPDPPIIQLESLSLHDRRNLSAVVDFILQPYPSGKLDVSSLKRLYFAPYALSDHGQVDRLVRAHHSLPEVYLE